MDSQYGIAVTNKFDLFGDDVTDPIEFLKEQEELKKKQELAKEKDKGKQGKDKKAKKQNASQSDNKSTEQPVQKKEGNGILGIINALKCFALLLQMKTRALQCHMATREISY
jgi:hypothetical protein